MPNGNPRRREFFLAIACCVLSSFLFPQLFASQHPPSPKLLKDYRRGNRGVIEQTWDGKYLLVHRVLRRKRPKDESAPFEDRRIQRLAMVESSTGRVIARVEYTEEFNSEYRIRPGSSEVILSNLRLVKPEKGKGAWLWDPDSNTVRSLAGVIPDRFVFLRFLDGNRMLGRYDPGGDSEQVMAEVNLGSGVFSEWSIKSNSFRRTDYALLTADGESILHIAKGQIIKRSIHEKADPEIVLSIEGEKIENFQYAQSHQWLIVVSWSEKQGAYDDVGDFLDTRAMKAYLSIYERESMRLLSRKRLFQNEETVDRVALLTRVRYKDGELEHLGYQLQLSPDDRFALVSYVRIDSAIGVLGIQREQPRYAIHLLSSGEGVGLARHPPTTFWESGWVSVSPMTAVRPFFSPDSKILYTTTGRFTRKWDVSQLKGTDQK